jgi:two-component system phosphate regulon sensor histidine kinase PhoR
VEVNLICLAKPLWLESDRDGFQTIASNLLSNAVRYTDAGGAVQITLSNSQQQLILEVSDTGIGMQPSDLERVFERFYRAHKDRASDTGGTGLGLSMVKHLTQALGGTVNATSQPNKGSTFVVELPLRRLPQ